MIEELIQKLKEVLDTVTGLQAVYIYEAPMFEETPVATISPSSNVDDYKTTAENIRIYAFDIRLYVSRTSAPPEITDKNEYADMIMRGLLDEVFRVLDKNYKMSGIVAPTGYDFVNMAVYPTSWGLAGREDEYRAVEMDVRCKVIINYNQIS